MKYSKNVVTYFLIIILVSCSGTRHAKNKVNDTDNAQQLKKEVRTEDVKGSTKNTIKSIRTSNNTSELNVLINASRTVKYTAFKLTEPLRLIVDLSNMEKNPNIPSELIINNDIINKIKIMHFKTGSISRIEIGLNKLVPHEIQRLKNNTLAINLKKGDGQATHKKNIAENNKPVPISSKISFPEISNKNIYKTKNINKKSEMQDEAEYEEFIEDENIIYEDIASNILRETHNEQTIIEEIKKKNYNQKTKPEKNKKLTQHKNVRYAGKLISLDFQDADVSNILRFIAEISNLNIITSDDVKGKVNLKLNNVPWDQALDIVLKAKGLGKEVVGNVIRVAPLIKLKAEKELLMKSIEVEREAKQNAEKARIEAIFAKEKIEDLLTEIISINYANVTDIVKNIEKLKSSRGEIDTNLRTNTLIIKDTKKSIIAIRKLIKSLDKRTSQVMIEARIVEVTRQISKEMGVQWGGHYSKTTSYAFPDNIGLTGGIAPVSQPAELQLINTLPGGGNFITNLPAAVGPGAGGALGINLGHIIGSTSLNVTLSALESSGNGKILSNPKITTEDNKKATIESGRSIPYTTVSQSGTAVDFVDAVISLEVTPHITQDGYVSMEIIATKNDADFANQVNGTPSILTKKAETKVLVKDGDTTVIGGLYTNNTSKSNSNVPFFSKIPIIGWLFRKKAKNEASTELLIFITPTIIKM